MSRYLPDFAGIFCLVYFLISLATRRDALLADGDPFWHIKAGSVMLEKRGLLDSDIFSHTASGTPWTAHEWLSEIVMAVVHKAAGLEGLLCFFLLIAAISMWLLYKITEKNAHPWLAFVCVALSVTISQGHLAARPHLFTWLLTIITLAILGTGGKRLYWLPLITAIWANLHGGFVLCLALQGIFIVGFFLQSSLVDKIPYREILHRQRTQVLVLMLSILAVGINPFGYELLAFPFHVSKGVFSEMINEWQAPNLQTMWYFRFYLVALVLLISLKKSAVTWTDRLLIIFFFNAALTHIRHVSLMLLALTPCIARMLDNHFGKWCHRRVEQQKNQIQMSSKSGPLVTTALALALLILGSVDHRLLAFLTPAKMINVDTGQLNQLVDFLEKDQPEGKMFNEYTLGGYLIYALNPPPKVFIDGRADMYGEQLLSDYSKIQSSSSEREKLLNKYAVDWVVFEKDSGLVRDLEETGRWQATFTNEVYSVVTRADPAKSLKRLSIE